MKLRSFVFLLVAGASFLSLKLYPEADVRLLAIGRTDDEARRHLAEMAEYVRPLRSQVEFGRTS
ncbi:MAG: hypothetical protein HC938_13590, partial [Nitrospira sp.]|nr:hypothetical protein [Nitrospira sp.]